MRWYPCRLVRPTHESCAPVRACLFRLRPRINSAIDDIPFEREDEVIDLPLITSLEADDITHLGGNHILDYLVTHLAKVLQQDYSSSINRRHQLRAQEI